ncbi:DDT domain-containing protein DDR4 isoform X2 [Rhodamnia argentea]|uniref:DDT domain-containing protein DDR4 isoform X2 n=1 Tax=Rhodamnia argentea TaxID=178133 RepID=A0A8B8QQP5_9MYRT|nr:DDT domain-containing protein DDR4 isoform X2 [Rhodamnia argentea]
MPRPRRVPAAAAAGNASEMKVDGREETPSMLDETGHEIGPEVLQKLREQWELASVLNFLSVFEPVIGNDLKLSAEEIEGGLIRPNSSIAQLHVKLLKGIPPISKALDGSDAWVTVLCKKLDSWWQWVSEGNMPLTLANGKEIYQYKELDPVGRLLLLRALCELRAIQDDAVSYINNALKDGTPISCFRKEKLASHGNGTSYWYEGDATCGHRLYRAVCIPKSKSTNSDERGVPLPFTMFRWDTLATNLDEFSEVVEALASSKGVAEVAVSKIIQSDIIPVLQKIKKNKERALKRKERQKMLLSNCKRFYPVAGSRSCRSRRPISYTFEEYDRAINEAIDVTERSTTEDQRRQYKHREFSKEDDSQNEDPDSSEGVGRNNIYDVPATQINKHGGAGNDYTDEEYDGKCSDDDCSRSNNSDEDCLGSTIDSPNNNNHPKRKIHVAHRVAGSRWSKRLAGAAAHAVEETRELHMKKLLRQRPTQNYALESAIIPDSDEENPL